MCGWGAGSEVGWGVVAPVGLVAMVTIAVDTIVVAVDDDGNTYE